MTAECDQELACEADGGTWNPGSGPDGAVLQSGCTPPRDAGQGDATPTFCCNANPDPCCSYLNCAGPMTTECSNELACEGDGGTWNPFSGFGPGGAVLIPGCKFSVDAGPDARDAAADTGADGDDH